MQHRVIILSECKIDISVNNVFDIIVYSNFYESCTLGHKMTILGLNMLPK
jgi:hypothetical protein